MTLSSLNLFRIAFTKLVEFDPEFNGYQENDGHILSGA